MSYLVIDIETYPDFKVWQPAAKKPRAKKDPADAFAPLFAHRPIAIGIAMFDDNLNFQHIGCLGTSTYKDDERALLSTLSTWMDQLATTSMPTLVTFAGRRFDLPVLALRALRHAIPHGWYTKDMRKRYTEEQHLDLFDALTESGAFEKTDFSLDTFSRIIGLPGKTGFDGSMVKAAFDRGEVAKIEGYCQVDVIRTSFLLMRYLMMRGRISFEQFQAVTKAFWDALTERQLTGALFGSDMNVLMGNPAPVLVAPQATTEAPAA